ncbi:MAG: cyclic nucleotide-binding domain-containing protein [Alphaproteobacteria bacterium]|nr:cyclic nucleotide-binding domain-containing protein [Alphaproteobacteria bacterium]
MKKIMEFKTGEKILSKGDKACNAYMIISGQVRIFLEKDSKVIDLATLGVDEIFGEAAVFAGEAYGANATALEDCELLVITPDSLSAMLEGADPIIQSLMRMLIERLKVTNEALLKSETREFMDIALI